MKSHGRLPEWSRPPQRRGKSLLAFQTAVGAAALLLLGGLFLPAPADVKAPVTAEVCTVQRIVDGDTLVCHEHAERIRLLLIDAPEMDQGRYGERARAALVELLPPGSTATMEFDVQERDRYGRILAYLFTSDGLMVNAALARAGYVVALVIPPNVRYETQIRAEVSRARVEGAGLWSGAAFDCSPSAHRAGRCD